MDLETSLDSIATDAQNDDDVNTENKAFQAQWQQSDTTQLQPANLPIARVRRAWERKPLSPFSRQKLRVGKVWKRAGGPRLAMVPREPTAQAGAKRARSRTSLDGPMRAVKKLRVEGQEGAVACVSQWEIRERPERKIVTRSARGEREGEGLIELDEEEGQEAREDADVTIELFDEDGNAMEADAEGGAAEHGWSDVEEDADGDDQVFDVTMHVGNAVVYEQEAQSTPDEEDGEPADIDCKIELPTERSNNETTRRSTNDDDAETSTEASAGPIVPPPLPPAQAGPLPDGFVSPVKQRRKLGPRASQAISAARRQTLPVEFAPSIDRDAELEQRDESNDSEIETAAAGQTAPLGSMRLEVDAGSVYEQQAPVSTEQGPGAMVDESWEDVEEETEALDADEAAEALTHESPSEAQQIQSDDAPMEGSDSHEITGVSSVESIEAVDDEEHRRAPAASPQVPAHKDLVSYDKMPSSPAPTIEGPHPRLPLRRSPRRKSSSPLKQKATGASEKPHHIAFTPLKRFSPFVDVRHTSPSTSVDATNHPAFDNTTIEPRISPYQRASSAPPEEPQMSPRKPAKPRVSDDTALLQAFLNRAAESKSTRRLSATEKESLTNRRDSDTIRQALASPAKADVLMDLDPNSPSPRKASGMSSPPLTNDTATVLSQSTKTEDEEGTEDFTGPNTRNRRSGRGRKKPQVYAQSSDPGFVSAAPSRITIRGSVANNVDLKKTEAQELAAVTKNNTKKNKGGSVFPALRLVKMAAEEKKTTTPATSQEEQPGEVDTAVAAAVSGEGAEDEVMPDVEVEVDVNDGKGRIRWAQTLVSFYQGTQDTDSSLLSDEVEERMPWERGADFDPTVEEIVAAPPPAAETPSKPKPKMRRLKTPRTATTPAKTATVVLPAAKGEAADGGAAEGVMPKAAPKARRSRIATPAKSLSTASLLPPDVSAKSARAPPAAVEKKAAPRKRTATSRLPAPGSISSTTSTAPVVAAAPSIAAAGKENTIASPAKKRPAAPKGALPTAKSFAPKLDFGKATELKPVSSVMESETLSLPGLASPAKKAGRKAALGFAGSVVGGVGEVGAGVGVGMGEGEVRGGVKRQEVPLGLRSPAKKRTRRTGD